MSESSRGESLIFRYYQLYEGDDFARKSRIRGTKPDYMLGVTFDDDRDFENECLYMLNYGDLFVCAINALINPAPIINKTEKYAKEWLKQSSKFYFSWRGGKAEDIYRTAFARSHIAQSEALFYATLRNVIELNIFKDGAIWTALTLPLLENETNIAGAVTTHELRQRLDELSVFNEIDTHITFISDGTEQYTFENIYNFISFEMRVLCKQDKEIKVCENCGKLFIPAVRSDEKYCYFEFENGKTCKQVAFSQKLKKDDILNAYRKTYKTQNARKQRNAHRPDISRRFDKWKAEAKAALRKCQAGEVSLDEMLKQISSADWIDGGDPHA